MAVVYDDVFHKMIARRAEAKDPELDLDEAFATVDKNILDACNAQIDTIVRATLHKDLASTSANVSQTSLTSQTEAAEAAAKRAEHATRAFEETQRRFQAGQFNPELPKKHAKRSLWMLGEFAKARQKKARRHQVVDEDVEDDEASEENWDEAEHYWKTSTRSGKADGKIQKDGKGSSKGWGGKGKRKW